GQGNLIHPNEFTNPSRIADAQKEGLHTGPWSQPFSKGCQITPDVFAIEELREEVQRLGYAHRTNSTYDEHGCVYGAPDRIRVEIKNK
ncbi:MAG: hypothetical protein ACLFRR_08230, partial [Spirochaetaceae bacterium]